LKKSTSIESFKNIKQSQKPAPGPTSTKLQHKSKKNQFSIDKKLGAEMAMFFKDKRQTNESRDAQTSPKFARSESKKSINNSMHHEFKREETG
jgi:hypothetical protein